MPVENIRNEEGLLASNATLPLSSWASEPQAQSQKTRERCKRRGAIALDLKVDEPLSVSDTITDGTIETDTVRDAPLTVDIENAHSAMQKQAHATNQPASQRPKSFPSKRSIKNYEIKDVEKDPRRITSTDKNSISLQRTVQAAGEARSNVIISREFDASQLTERVVHSSSIRPGWQTAVIDEVNNNHKLAPFISPHVRMKRQQENSALSEQKRTGHAGIPHSSDSVATDITNPQGANSNNALNEVHPNNPLRDNTLQHNLTVIANAGGRNILSRSITSSKNRSSADTHRHRDSIRRAESAPRIRNRSISRKDKSIQDKNQKNTTEISNAEGRGRLCQSITSLKNRNSTGTKNHEERIQRTISAPRSRNPTISHVGQIDPTGSFDVVSTHSLSPSQVQDRYRSRRQTVGGCEHVENKHHLATEDDSSQRRPQVRSRHRSLDEEMGPFSQHRTRMKVHNLGQSSSPRKKSNESEQEPRRRSNFEDNLRRHVSKARTAAEDFSTISGLSRKSTRQYQNVLAPDDVITRCSENSFSTRQVHEQSYRPRKNRTAADEMSFSTRHTSTSYPGRRRRTHYSDNGQFPASQAMYRSKSASRSLPNTNGFTEDEKSYNTIDNFDFIDCYSIPIVDDDPSLITDTASYDFRSRRSNRRYAPSAYLSADSTSVQSRTVHDDDFTAVTSRKSSQITPTSTHSSVKSIMVHDDDFTDALSRRSTRTYGTPAPSCVKSPSVYDDDLTDANGDFDELTEFESVQNAPGRTDLPQIPVPTKGLNRKHFVCVSTTVVLALAAIGTIIVLVALPAINKRRLNSMKAREEGEQVGPVNNSIIPSTQPSLGALTEVLQLPPPPKDLEERCSPSNFPDGSRVCKEYCRAAECCYPGVHESRGENIKCFDISNNLAQCEAYRPHCDVIYDPWIGSTDGIIRPPPSNLDEVCTNRRRRHYGRDIGLDEAVDSRSLAGGALSHVFRSRVLGSDDFECLKACLPSKCCSGIKVADQIPNIDGNYPMTSCTEKNEVSCQAYEKLCQGVFERHDAFSQIEESSLTPSPDSSIKRATFTPTVATIPVASPVPLLYESVDSSQTDTSPYNPPMGSHLYTPTAGNYHPTSSSPTYHSSVSSYPNNRPTHVPPSMSNHHYNSSSSSPSVAIIESSPSGTDSSLSSTGIPFTTSMSPSPPIPVFGNSSSFTPSQNRPNSTSDNVTSTTESTVSNSFVSAPNKPHESQANESQESVLSPAPSSPRPFLMSKPPSAVIEQINAACTGDENVKDLRNVDKKECLNACRTGMCCYIDQFNAAGIISRDENGFPVNVESCMKGNEVICADYANCLVMTVGRESIKTHSPSPTLVIPRPLSSDPVPFANSGLIFEACSSPDNVKLITNQDLQASMKCLDACSEGLCCYIDMFSKRGITAFDEEGNALVIDSCWEGNEEVCTGYEGCLVLTLTGPKPTPSSPALNSSSATPSLFAPPPPTVPPTTASPVTTVPATARPKPSSQSTKLTSKPTELIGSFSEVDSIAPAPLEAITKACTGTEKTNLLSRGDEETQAECLSVCSQGACCFAEIFNAIGISVIDETGNHVDIKSCLEGNEIACKDYSGCLSLSLSYSRPATTSPTTATPAPSVLIKFVAEAPLEEINSACTGKENIDRITNGDEKAITECFNVCWLGVCCYASVFNAIGISAIDEQGNNIPIDSCFAGNELICRDYSGCLTLTLAV
ncbi:hypothetical protein ACHAW6_012340 [Cyclotella cf. meneghiniana]